MDATAGLVGVVLERFLEGSGGGGGEDGAVAGVVVEGVAVDAVGGLFGGEEEDGAGVGGRGGCFGWIMRLVQMFVATWLGWGRLPTALVKKTYAREALAGTSGEGWRWAIRRQSWTISSSRRRRCSSWHAFLTKEGRKIEEQVRVSRVR